jgi:hypothetical protein
MTLIFLHLAKQRWLDEEFLLSLKLDGLSPFKLDGILDDSDLFHLAKQRWLDEEFLLSLKLDGLSPFKLDGIADDSDLLSSSQAEMAWWGVPSFSQAWWAQSFQAWWDCMMNSVIKPSRWLDEEFLLSLKLDGLSFQAWWDSLIFLHQAKQRWLDEEFLLSLKLDGLSPFKLDGIADDSDLLSSSQAEVAWWGVPSFSQAWWAQSFQAWWDFRWLWSSFIKPSRDGLMRKIPSFSQAWWAQSFQAWWDSI